MDEISLLGETEVHEVKENSLNQFYLFPDQLGFRKPSLHELRGGKADQNARALTEILSNQDRSSRRDLIVINSAAALVIAGVVSRMEAGIQLANEILDSGQALAKLREFQNFFKG